MALWLLGFPLLANLGERSGWTGGGQAGVPHRPRALVQALVVRQTTAPSGSEGGGSEPVWSISWPYPPTIEAPDRSARPRADCGRSQHGTVPRRVGHESLPGRFVPGAAL